MNIFSAKVINQESEGRTTNRIIVVSMLQKCALHTQAVISVKRHATGSKWPALQVPNKSGKSKQLSNLESVVIPCCIYANRHCHPHCQSVDRLVILGSRLSRSS